MFDDAPEEIFEASILRHLPGLLGRAVRVDHGLYAPTGMIARSNGATLAVCETPGQRRVAAEEHPILPASIVYPLYPRYVSLRIPCAPMIDLERAHVERPGAQSGAPTQFADRAIAADAQQIGRACRGDHGRITARQTPQAGQVEVAICACESRITSIGGRARISSAGAMIRLIPSVTGAIPMPARTLNTDP